MVTTQRNGLHFIEDEVFCPSLGNYEIKKQRLAKERQADYNKFLGEKERLEKKRRVKQTENNSDETDETIEEQRKRGAYRVDEEPAYFSIKTDNFHKTLSEQSVKEEHDPPRRILQPFPAEYASVSINGPPSSSQDTTKSLKIQSLPSTSRGPIDESTSARPKIRQTSVPASSGHRRKTERRDDDIRRSMFGDLDYSSAFLEKQLLEKQLLKLKYQRELEKQVQEKLRRDAEEKEKEKRDYGLFVAKMIEDEFSKQAVRKAVEEQIRNISISTEKKAFSGEPESRLSDLPAKELIVKDNYMNMLQDQVDQQKMNQLPPPPNKISQDPMAMGRTGGGGAPVRDSAGNIITARRGVLPTKPPWFADEGHLIQQKTEVYRSDLRKQIAENQRRATIEREKQLLEEQHLAEKIEEDRLKMQREYDQEKAKRLQREEEARLKRERIAQLQEERAREEEQRRKEEAERKRQEKKSVIEEDLPKPVIDYPKSPPVPTIRAQETMKIAKRNINTPVKPVETSVPESNVLSQLTELRQLVRQEQLQDATLRDEKKSYKVMNRRAVQDDSDDEDDDDINYRRQGEINMG